MLCDLLEILHSVNHAKMIPKYALVGKIYSFIGYVYKYSDALNINHAFSYGK
jgi:hypothetical protein